MNDRPIVFLDCETLGLDINDPIWEIALIRREPDGVETEHHFLVADEDGMAYDAPANFPEPFAGDFQRRYRDSDADLTDHADLKVLLRYLLRPVNGIKPHIVGAVPNFDTERIAHQFGVTGWHHRLRCVETLTAGHLGRDVGGLSACAEALGIPVQDAHTAMGDVLMCRAIWDRVMGAKP